MDVLRLGPRTIDLRHRTVREGLNEEALTEKVAALLAYLAARPGKDIAQDELLTRSAFRTPCRPSQGQKKRRRD